MRRREDKVSRLRKDSAVTGRLNHPEAKAMRPESDTEVEATSIPALLEREDGTPMAWYRSVYAPRTEGAHGSHHRTAGIAGRTRRRGCVAARGERAAAGGAGDRVCQPHFCPEFCQTLVSLSQGTG